MNVDSIGQLGNRYSQHSFSQVPSVHTARSKFDRSFAIKDTLFFDYLNPIFCDEILPGDSINLTVKSFARLATQLVPVMDNMYLDYFFFFVPCRLLWNNWEKFNGAQDNPGDTTSYVIPTIASPGTGFTVGSIYDKFGLPTDVANVININALPLRAYNLIWKEWFRDENLQNSPAINKGDGPDANTDYTLLKRAKKQDYFTSCLPNPQKGTAVTIPLGTEANILRRTNATSWDVYGSASNTKSPANTHLTTNSGIAGRLDVVGGSGVSLDPNGQLYADLSTATAASINLFRQAIMVQSLLELDARGGTRYVEIIRAHWNVVSPDFRLQRPEFLAGGTTSIVQHPIPQTSQTSGTNYQANLAAFSTASQQGNNIGCSKSFVEHGYVIGLVQARGDVTYQQGVNRMWSRSTRYDFFWPKLQELGEQTVLNKEIYAQGTAADLLAFGYQERYAEYRYMPSQIRGQFRSTYATSLNVWHLAEKFTTLPALNSTFIQSNTPIDRSLAVTAGYPHLLYDAWFDYKHARAMVTYGVPATLGRF